MAGFEAFLAAISGATTAAVSAASSIGGAALNNRRAFKNWQRQHDIAVEDWSRQNDYNLPVNQVRRLQEAGINPLLINGQSANASSINSPGQIENIPYDFSGIAAIQQNAFNNFLRAGEFARSNALVEQQINESKSRESNYNELAGLNAARTAFDLLKYEGYKSNDMFGLQADYTRKKIAQLIAGISQQELYNEFLDRTLETRIKFEQLKNDFERSRTALNWSSREVNFSRRDLNKQDYNWNLHTYYDRRQTMWKTNRLLDSRLNLQNAMKDYYINRSLYTGRKFDLLIPELFLQAFGTASKFM